MVVKSRDKGSFKILFINSDYPEISRSAGLVLAKAGYEINRIADGFQALSRLEAEYFSMVILGPSLKNMTNLELVILIRANKEFDLARLPIIQIFPPNKLKEGPYTYEECLEVGVNEIIKKYNPKNLSESIKFYYDIYKESLKK